MTSIDSTTPRDDIAETGHQQRHGAAERGPVSRQGRNADRSVLAQSSGALADLPIRTKLIASFAVVLLMLLAISAFGLHNLRFGVDALDKLHAEAVGNQRILSEMQQVLADSRMQVALALQHEPTSPFASQHDHALDTHLKALDADRAAVEQLSRQLTTEQLDAA